MKKETFAQIPFTKMHGLGNDYIFIDRFRYKDEHDWGPLARAISDRHFGVGSDGLILVEPSDVAHFRMRMFNSDGSEGDMCGNGMRCFSRYVFEAGQTTKTEFEVETRAGIIKPKLLLEDGTPGSVTVDMGKPRFGRSEIPLAQLAGPEPVVDERVELEGEVLYGTALFLGNPHCVFFVSDVWAVDLERLGPPLERHALFPKKANIEFVSLRSPNMLDMRVWERGSGVTLACGTGASASVVAAVLKGMADRDQRVTVNLPGGPLQVEWRSDNHVWQTGPAARVCSGLFFYGTKQ